MNTNRTTRIAGFIIALFLTAAIHGALLWKFDAVAHEATLAAAVQGSSAAATI